MWNYNVTLRIILTPVVVLAATRNDINRGLLAVMAAILAFSLVAKAIDWMRLFN